MISAQRRNEVGHLRWANAQRARMPNRLPVWLKTPGTCGWIVPAGWRQQAQYLCRVAVVATWDRHVTALWSRSGPPVEIFSNG